MALGSCPTNDALVAFHVGDLSETELEALTRHVEQCPQCEEKLQQLDGAPDPVVAALRQSSPSKKTPTVARVGSAQDSSGSAIDLTQGPAESYPFLSPPKAANEIGWLAHYRIIKLLGRGGMGMVFQAEDSHLLRPVALKVLSPDAGAGMAPRQRFIREARATAALSNDHIVTIFQVGEERQIPFIAMEYLKGESLDAWLRRGVCPTLADILRIGREIAEGLAAAHEAGLIHRDIKPANIWLEQKGSKTGAAEPVRADVTPLPGNRSVPPFRVKILDFGLAQVASDDIRLTQTGYIVGTPAYMSPEQARNENVNARADLFSLGCVLYRLATGRAPFRGDTTMALLVALAVDSPQPMRELKPDLPPALCELVSWMLAKNAMDRPGSARTVIDALSAIEQEIGSAVLVAPLATLVPERDAVNNTQAMSCAITPNVPQVLTAPTRSAKPPRRRHLLVGALFLGMGAALGAAVLLWNNPGRGDVTLDSDGPKAAALLKQRGGVTLRERRSHRTVRLLSLGTHSLPPGEYEVAETGSDDGMSFAPAAFTLKKGDKVAVSASLPRKATPPPPPVAPPDLALEAWIKKVSAMKGPPQAQAVQEKLRERNPHFRGAFTPSFYEENIHELLVDTDHVTDIAPLRALKKVRTLRLNGGDPNRPADLADLTPLKGMVLNELRISHTRVANLEPLRGMPLTRLDAENTLVRSLEPLRQSTQLEHLVCSRTEVSDLTPLAKLPLKLLSVDRTPVTDLTPLANVSLVHLDCSFTNVASLAPLKSKTLEHLACFGTMVTDFSPLAGMPLVFLTGPIDPARHAKVLRALPKLTSINNTPAEKFWKDGGVP